MYAIQEDLSLQKKLEEAAAADGVPHRRKKHRQAFDPDNPFGDGGEAAVHAVYMYTHGTCRNLASYHAHECRSWRGRGGGRAVPGEIKDHDAAIP